MKAWATSLHSDSPDAQDKTDMPVASDMTNTVGDLHAESNKVFTFSFSQIDHFIQADAIIVPRVQIHIQQV